jgi:hypothetical protein
MTPLKFFFVIADISGYTNFIRSRSIEPSKAEFITVELLESILKASENPLTALELEGDAILFYAISDNSSYMANQIYQQALIMISSFENRKKELKILEDDKEVKEELEKLKLKIILHHGQGIMSKIHQFYKVIGEDIILVHRLLKNSIQHKEYILLSQSFYEMTNIHYTQEPQQFQEFYQDLGFVKGMVYSTNY